MDPEYENSTLDESNDTTTAEMQVINVVGNWYLQMLVRFGPTHVQIALVVYKVEVDSKGANLITNNHIIYTAKFENRSFVMLQVGSHRKKTYGFIQLLLAILIWFIIE